MLYKTKIFVCKCYRYETKKLEQKNNQTINVYEYT